MQKFDTTSPISVVLEIPAGRIEFVAADRTDTVVEVLPQDAKKGRDVKAAEETTVAYADGVLRIQGSEAAHRVLGSSGSVAITIQLPAGSAVAAKAEAAEYRGVGRLGDVTIEGGLDVVDFEETAGAQFTVLAGAVRIGRLAGDARISTQNGDITVAEAGAGHVVLDTQNGSISIGAAAGVSATLDAGTKHGRISNVLKNSEGAGAALTIHASTNNGDITAHSL